MKRFTECLEVYPDIEELNDGIYHGQIAGSVFEYEGNHYRCPFGIRQTTPVSLTIKIENHEIKDKIWN